YAVGGCSAVRDAMALRTVAMGSVTEAARPLNAVSQHEEPEERVIRLGTQAVRKGEPPGDQVAEEGRLLGQPPEKTSRCHSDRSARRVAHVAKLSAMRWKAARNT